MLFFCNTNYYRTMRAIINISLPKQMAGLVDEIVASGRYATKSEFFRSLLRTWMEERLLKDLEGSRGELKKGEGKLLKSLKDLY